MLKRKRLSGDKGWPIDEILVEPNLERMRKGLRTEP